MNGLGFFRSYANIFFFFFSFGKIFVLYRKYGRRWVYTYIWIYQGMNFAFLNVAEHKE